MLGGSYAPARLFHNILPSTGARIWSAACAKIMIGGSPPAATTPNLQRTMSTQRVFFEVFAVPPNHVDEVRLGKLSCLGRTEIETPNYIALSARGAVPHLSQDTVRNHTTIRGIHMALEDCESFTRAVDLVQQPVANGHALAGLESPRTGC